MCLSDIENLNEHEYKQKSYIHFCEPILNCTQIICKTQVTIIGGEIVKKDNLATRRTTLYCTLRIALFGLF